MDFRRHEDHPHTPDPPDTRRRLKIIGIVSAIVIAVAIILLVASFDYVEYYEVRAHTRTHVLGVTCY